MSYAFNSNYEPPEVPLCTLNNYYAIFVHFTFIFTFHVIIYIHVGWITYNITSILIFIVIVNEQIKFFFSQKEHLLSLKNINKFHERRRFNQFNIKKNNRNYLHIRHNISDILLNPLFFFSFFPFLIVILSILSSQGEFFFYVVRFYYSYEQFLL